MQNRGIDRNNRLNNDMKYYKTDANNNYLSDEDYSHEGKY